MRDKQKRRRERTWAEAARMVLENYSDAPMTPKQILNVIEAEGLKETNGSSPLACLNAMLHSNCRTREALFYKLPGRISLFTMKKNAVQWSRVVSLPEDGDTEDTADEESSQWNEGSSMPAVETSGNASCSRESHVRETRSLVQVNKQKRRSGVLLPRVVLTPLKVNGAHLPSTSGLSVRHVESESSSNHTLGGSLTFNRRAALSGNSTHHLRSNKNTSALGQAKKKEEEIDFETPGSILVNTNLRALINVRTFNALPTHLQHQLLLLLPEVDRQVTPEGQLRMSGSALNNEFFAHACQRWRERLSDGEFTPETQLRMRQEMGKEKKVEDWKEKFFEDFYGQKFGLSEEPEADPEDKYNQPETICVQQVVQRTSPGPGRNEESVPELQGRTRRSLYRNKEGIQQTLPAAEVKAISSPCPERAEADIPVLEHKVFSRDAGSLPSTSERVPELHPETSEQKKKTSEPETSSPSLEKKPRMEQRQSFRNTIQSVHPEKPQPTKEEPKVPPIRIQLSRIKPPWVVKGLPSYQICPRIIPDSDPTGRWTPSCSSVDSQTRGPHFQNSIGGGGGPGGGYNTNKRSGPRDSNRSRRSAKRRHRKKPTNCCRTQLLPSSAVRETTEKEEVPRVKISLIRSSSETREHLCDSITKERYDTEAAVPNGKFAAQPLDYYQTTEMAADVCEEDRMVDKEEENKIGGISTAVRMATPAVDGSTGHGTVGQFCETLASVLGDVSNTFQNRIKQVTSSLTDKESNEKKGDRVLVESHEPDLAEHQESSSSPVVDFHSVKNLQATQTSPTEHQLAMCTNDTSTPNPDWDYVSNSCYNRQVRESVPCQLVSVSNDLDLHKPNDSDLLNGALQNQEESLQSLTPLCDKLCKISPVQETSVSFLEWEADPAVNDCKGSMDSLHPRALHSVVNTDVKEVLSEFPNSSGKGFLAGNIKDEQGSMQSTMSSSESTKPGKGLDATGSQSSTGIEPCPYPSPSPCKDIPLGFQDSSEEQGRFLDNSVEFINRVPLFFDMPFLCFPKDVGVRVQLPASLSSHQKMKNSLFGKMSLQSTEGEYSYSAGVLLSGFPGAYTVAGSASLSVEVFAEHDSGEKVSLRCSCSFKAMTMCEGCGAFCHIDCIGPSKLCVSCLVIR
ncbi:polycomb group protein ASXL1 isoform X2 [Mixophyes fleayi]|uniref:polycomb group protein ASXL1 isoform X2 n=1 Tax=Mixophyes fleayi TaxID=3061075 RepID=UPI003F4DF1C2